MKKFNVNIILFVFVCIFIAAGIWGNCFDRLKWETIYLLSGIKHLNMETVMNAKDTIDKVSSEELGYHDLMMEIDSARNNLLGTRVVIKDDTTVVKAYSDSLCEPSRKLDDSEIEEVVCRIQEFRKVSEENGSRFLYCAAPAKELYEQLPGNADNYMQENFERFLAGMESSQIPVLDLPAVLKDNNLTTGTDIFYYTDHHWKVYPGFIASAAVSKELSARYGFEYNEQYTDLQNYTVTSYPDWFLGSKGKKVGRFFSLHGTDDFELITPDFKTDMTEEQPIKGEVREGTFEETVLYMQYMEKDYYHASPYSIYSGGDFRLQIMKNNLNPDGKKILLVRDSFACAVAPFLALQTSELHICDIRDYEYFVGDRISLEDYIQQIKPDYVIVLYSGVSSVSQSHGLYDFLKQ